MSREGVDVAVGDRHANCLEHGVPSSAIVVSVRVVGSYSNDARMTRAPFASRPPPCYTARPHGGTMDLVDLTYSCRIRVANAPAAKASGAIPTDTHMGHKSAGAPRNSGATGIRVSHAIPNAVANQCTVGRDLPRKANG